MAKIRVTLKKSLASRNSRDKKTVLALGLRKIGQAREFEKTPAIDGMLKKVNYMIKTEDI
ncbi:MAG: 50S ribosomal protein L30 [Candidatus Goldiibacteriota bacterium]